MTTTHRLTAGIAVALALGAGAAPAVARPFDLNANGSYVLVPPSGTPAQARPAQTAPSPVVVHIDRSSGFDWGDAAIGAAGGVALSIVAVGGGLAVSHGRDAETRRSRAAIG